MAKTSSSTVKKGAFKSSRLKSHRPKKTQGTRWSKREDGRLTGIVLAAESRGGRRQHCRWSSIAESMPGRSGKQCRERWLNILHPNIKKGNWTAQEDLLICRLQEELGNKWKKIAESLPGRTDNAVKNRWHSCKKNIDNETTTTIMASSTTSHRSNNPKPKTEDSQKKVRATKKKQIITTGVHSHSTPTKNFVNGHTAKQLVSESLVSESFVSESSIMAASTLSAMKHGGSLVPSVGRKTNNGRMASHAVNADDIFSPSYFTATATPSTPSFPLETLPSCDSGPFISNTPMFKDRNMGMVRGKRLFSRDDEEGSKYPTMYAV